VRKSYLLVFLSLTAFSQIHKAEIWSEGLFVTKESTISSSVFARAFAPTGFEIQPYIQMGQMTFGSNEVSPDWYWASGLHWNWQAIRAFGEYRVHSPKKEQSPNEWRILLVYGELFEEALKGGSSYLLFFEPYAEASWIASSENIYVNLLPRGGMRLRWNRETTSDLFLEPAIHLRKVLKFEQDLELRPTGRVQHCRDSFCVSLSASVAEHFRLLATFGGSL